MGLCVLCAALSSAKKKKRQRVNSRTSKTGGWRERPIQRRREGYSLYLGNDGGGRDGGTQGSEGGVEIENNQSVQRERGGGTMNKLNGEREGGRRALSEGWVVFQAEEAEVLLQSCWRTGWEPRIMLRPSACGGSPDTL